MIIPFVNGLIPADLGFCQDWVVIPQASKWDYHEDPKQIKMFNNTFILLKLT